MDIIKNLEQQKAEATLRVCEIEQQIKKEKAVTKSQKLDDLKHYIKSLVGKKVYLSINGDIYIGILEDTEKEYLSKIMLKFSKMIKISDNPDVDIFLIDDMHSEYIDFYIKDEYLDNPPIREYTKEMTQKFEYLAKRIYNITNFIKEPYEPVQDS